MSAPRARESFLMRERLPIAIFMLFLLLPIAVAFGADSYLLDLLMRVMIFAIAALGLDLVVGFGALVSFGHAAFIGIGAYAVGILASHGISEVWIVLPVAILAASAFAYLTGAICLRIRGVYFIMITLAFAQMFYFLFHDTDFGRGSDGITMNFRPAARLGGLEPFDLSRPVHAYYFVLAAMLLVLAFLR